MYSHIHILITKKNIIIKATTILYSSHYFLKNTLFFILLGVWGLLTLPFPFVTIGIRLYMQLIYSSL